MEEHIQRRVEQHLRSFQRVMDEYQSSEPFARFITAFFKANKQMGSSDRRMTSRYCYNYFRLGEAYPSLDRLDRVVIADFLCESESALVAYREPTWVEKQAAPLTEKISFLASLDKAPGAEVFPFAAPLSAGIDAAEFAFSHFLQPDLFIRVKRGSEAQLEKEFKKHDIDFKREAGQAYRLANKTRLQDLKGVTGLYEVQDLSSQSTIDFIPASAGQKWWDACAGSGGKSLMLLDQEPKVDLLVSDVRLSILRNLDERFDQAGVKQYRKKIVDISVDPSAVMAGESFDGILLDVPCSGSGTWGRTPEMLVQFKEEQIQAYATKQKAIVMNTLPYLKAGGHLTYITCSVFEEENEAMVRHLEDECGMELVKMQTLIGYTLKADSMFAALLRKK